MKKGITFVGMDAHKVAIKLAVLVAGETKPVEWSVANCPAPAGTRLPDGRVSYRQGVRDDKGTHTSIT